MALSAHAIEPISSDPVITSLTPSTAFVGDTVLIKGSGFDDSNVTATKLFYVNSWFVWPDYQYESIQAEIIAVTDTTIVAIVPLGASTGEISITVNGQVATSENPMYYGVRINLQSFTPDTGYVGDTITIAGTGFKAGYPAANYVWFKNGVNTTAIAATATSIKVIIPRGTTTGPVRLFTNTPFVTSTFNFNILPAIRYLEQTSGQVGNQVTIEGNGFDPALSSEYHITFNGTPAVITLVTADIIMTKVPARSTSGPVKLIYNNKEIKGSGIQYTVIGTTPGITTVTPGSGVIGTAVKISGSAFDQGGPLTVSFGGILARIDSFTNQTIYTKVPVGGRSGQVIVTAGGRSSENHSSVGFRVIQTVHGMEPASANVGDTVVVSGTGFASQSPGDYYTIWFTNSNESIHPVSVTDTTLKFVIPVNAFHSVEPLVTSSYHLAINFKLPLLNIMPLIKRIEPDTVIEGRQMEIKIHGSGFPYNFFRDRIAVIFPANTVQPITSLNTSTSFVATVPQTVENGVVPVSVRIQDLLSNSVNLVILPDTFPYVPLHPEFFGATDVTATSFKCFWSKSYRALGYLLDVSENDFETYVPGYKELAVTDLSKVVSGLNPGTTYSFRLRPYSDTDTAAYQYVEHVTTIPNAPVAHQPVNASENGFTCRWSRVKGAESYYIEASNDFFDTFISTYVSDTLVMLSLTGRLPVPVSYRVKAANSSGMSDYSNVITIVITGTEDETSQVTYYPNPAKEQLFISGLNEAVKESRLVDPNGKVTPVNLNKKDSTTYSLDIRTLPGGLYILQLAVNQKVIQVKFIKE